MYYERIWFVEQIIIILICGAIGQAFANWEDFLQTDDMSEPERKK